MSRSVVRFSLLALTLALAACNAKAGAKPRLPTRNLSAEQRDAEQLGREIFDLVDRAMDYRGSHEGRPANNLRQMGVESLTAATVRRVVNVQREPVVTVAYRKTGGREILSCRGDRQVLEDAFLNAGRFTIMCTASSGDQRPIEVGESED